MKLTHEQLADVNVLLENNVKNEDDALALGNLMVREYFRGKKYAIVETVAQIEGIDWNEAYNLIADAGFQPNEVKS